MLIRKGCAYANGHSGESAKKAPQRAFFRATADGSEHKNTPLTHPTLERLDSPKDNQAINSSYFRGLAYPREAGAAQNKPAKGGGCILAALVREARSEPWQQVTQTEKPASTDKPAKAYQLGKF